MVAMTTGRMRWLCYLMSFALVACAGPLGLILEDVEFDAQGPILKWEAFPSSRDRDADDQGLLNEAKKISYDLRIFRVKTGELVVDQRGLQKPSYRPGSALRDGRRYCWTVRARFRLNGQLRLGPWSTRGANPLDGRFVPIPSARLAQFQM